MDDQIDISKTDFRGACWSFCFSLCRVRQRRVRRKQDWSARGGTSLWFGRTGDGLFARPYLRLPHHPAVTIGLALSGNFGWRQVPGYIAAQVIGGIFAAAALFLIAHTRPGFNPAVTGFAANGYGLHSPGPGNYGVLAAFVTEGILTALLVLTVLGSTGAGAKTDLAGFAIGLVVTAALLVGIPITGASINPALAWRRLSLWVAGRSANCGSLSLHRSPVPH
jgi:glycerol uptake facilitator-like aquaporin